MLFRSGTTHERLESLNHDTEIHQPPKAAAAEELVSQFARLSFPSATSNALSIVLFDVGTTYYLSHGELERNLPQQKKNTIRKEILAILINTWSIRSDRGSDKLGALNELEL